MCRISYYFIKKIFESIPIDKFFEFCWTDKITFNLILYTIQYTTYYIKIRNKFSYLIIHPYPNCYSLDKTNIINKVSTTINQ